MSALRKLEPVTGSRHGSTRFGLLLRGLLLFVPMAAGAPALAVPTCTVASGATLSFGAIVALASTGDVTSNSGSSFWVNCTSDVTTTPALYSATSRTLQSGSNNLPFALSGVSAGSTELPATSPGMSLGITKNGTNQTVTLYGKVLATDFRALPSGSYSRVISLTLEY